jgi:type IV secretory pathway TraG/TraD family ATPase VirD4
MGNKDPSQISDETLFWGVGFIFLLIAFNKAYEFMRIWIQTPKNQIVLLTLIILILTPVFYWLARKREINLKKIADEKAVIGKSESSVFCGETDKKEEVHIKTRQRAMHTQVIGTTNAGKTESVILPWAIQDIEQGRGLILIDGKSDRSLLDKLWSYSVKYNRQKDFRLFSLSSIEESHQFNPLLNGSPEEVAERVFNSFEFENEYYRSVQFEVFAQVMRIFSESKETPTFLKVFEAISTPNKLKALAEKTENHGLKNWAKHYAGLPATEVAQRTSGLTAALSHFAFGRTSALFNSTTPSIDLDTALSENQIIYFQLPVMLSPFLGKASGKMILQCLQSAVANRHRGERRSHNFFSVFLDDFSEYLYPGFVTILNKSRSANVGIVFAHQALGDIKTMGDAIANSILTNANLKVFMRGNDPESAEYFSKVIGTVKSIKYTSRTKKGLWKQEDTGDASAREADEFIIHPNRFKNELGVGQAVMVIPHEAGSRTINIKFQKFDDLPPENFLKVEKTVSAGLADLPETETPKFPGGKNAA